MKKYYEFLYCLRADGVASRSALERRNRGRSAEQIDECLSLGYIAIYDTNDIGIPRYCITQLGEEYLDNV